MASHSEIRVGDTDWVIRIGGGDVQVKILEKTRKASGRGWEFRVKRFENGRSVGRNLVRGSGAFRRPGEAVRATGFSGNKPAAAKAKARAAKPKPKRKAPPRPRPQTSYNPNPPASAFFSTVQEPGSPRSSAASSPADGRLRSLRGRGRLGSSSSPAAPSRSAAKSKTPGMAKKEIVKLIKSAKLSPLITSLAVALVECDGTERSAVEIYGISMAKHRMGTLGVRYRR